MDFCCLFSGHLNYTALHNMNVADSLYSSCFPSGGIFIKEVRYKLDKLLLDGP